MHTDNYFRIKPLEFDLFCGMDVDKKVSQLLSFRTMGP
jgi:hypothetical protein